jgi:hypothetical protein
MAGREEELEAKVKDLEAKLAASEHSLGHAVEKLGGELRYPHHDDSDHATQVTTTTQGNDTVVTTK